MKSSTSLPFKNFFINAYLLPGFLFILTIVLVCFVFREELYDWAIFKTTIFDNLNSLSDIKKILTTDISLFVEFLILVGIIFMSLIIGNGISVLAGLLFDTLWMGRGIGWPFERILSIPPKNYTRRAFNIFTYTFLNVITILYILNALNGFLFSLLAIFIIIFYFFFREVWIKSFLFKVYGNDKEIEEYLISESRDYPEKIYEQNFVLFNLYKAKNKNKPYWFYPIHILFVFPIDFSVYIATVLGKFFNLSLGIDLTSKDKFKTKFLKTFKLNQLNNSTNIYWYIYIYLSKSNVDAVRTANSHLKRSILLRNLAGAGVLLLYLFFLLKPEFKETVETNAKNYPYYRWKVWAFVWYFCTFLLFIGYNHIYHKYYTKFLIRCFLIDDDLKSTTHNNGYK